MEIVKTKLFQTDLPAEERARDAVKHMTLEEKVSQLMYKSAGVPRLGIPDYHWWNECLHGAARAGVATVFPQAIGMAAMMDEAFLLRVATAISDEIRGKYNDYQSIGDSGIYKGLTEYAPNVNLFRDPRWGRGQETYGEDPYLTARCGVAFIQGIQGNDREHLKAAANVKHFVVHSGPESLRHEIDVHISEKEFRETYLYAFAQCIREANVECVMGAYNRLNGEPCSGSAALMKKLLRDELGFRGFTVSDSFAVDDFHLHHKITAGPVESAALAFNSGCEQNGGTTYRYLTQAVQRGLVSEADIDEAACRLLGERVRLGMFDEHTAFDGIHPNVVDCEAHRELACEAARRSMVLLKNRGGLLPLKEIRSLAVIGPNADSREVLLGNYNGTMSRYSTLLCGIRERAEKAGVRVRYAEGCSLYRPLIELVEADLIPEAILAAQKCDAVVLCLGLAPMLEGEESDDPTVFQLDDRVPYTWKGMQEEPGQELDRHGMTERKREFIDQIARLGLPGRQAELLLRVAAVGKPVIAVLTNGGALSIADEEPLCDAIIEVWYPGEEGGKALGELLFGDFSPIGRMPVTTVKTPEDLPPFEDYRMEGRTYRFLRKDPLFPFGFGLSYSSFRYQTEGFPEKLAVGEELRFTALVTNTGKRDAKAALQVYLTDEEASVRTPNRQLVWFGHLWLPAGQSGRAEITVPARLMAVVLESGECRLESGWFGVSVGGIQPDEVSRSLSDDPVVLRRFLLDGADRTISY
jgi:beta-glucosidase